MYGWMIKALRAATGLGYKDFCEATGLTSKTIVRLENTGKIPIGPSRRLGQVSAETIQKINAAAHAHGFEMSAKGPVLRLEKWER